MLIITFDWIQILRYGLYQHFNYYKLSLICYYNTCSFVPMMQYFANNFNWNWHFGITFSQLLISFTREIWFHDFFKTGYFISVFCCTRLNCLVFFSFESVGRTCCVRDVRFIHGNQPIRSLHPPKLSERMAVTGQDSGSGFRDRESWPSVCCKQTCVWNLLGHLDASSWIFSAHNSHCKSPPRVPVTSHGRAIL